MALPPDADLINLLSQLNSALNVLREAMTDLTDKRTPGDYELASRRHVLDQASRVVEEDLPRIIDELKAARTVIWVLRTKTPKQYTECVVCGGVRPDHVMGCELVEFDRLTWKQPPSGLALYRPEIPGE